MRTLFALVLIGFATLASAASEMWPSLYDVVDVASDDVLNVRSEPTAQSQIVGSLAHDATDIEVVELSDNGWGRVNIGEGSGWVSMRYMDGIPRLSGYFPPITSCYGTEPFWGLIYESDLVTLSFPTGPDVTTSIQQTIDIWTLTRFGIAGDGLTGIIRHQSCTDGMSDRRYGLSMDLMVQTNGEWAQYSDCCSIQP